MAKTYLESGEIQKLEQAADNLRDKLLIRLLFHLGCRVSEALGLEIKDIDFAANTVIIEHLKFRIKLDCPKCAARLGKSHTYCPKCGEKVEAAITKELEHRRRRMLPLDPETMAMLHDYIKRGGTVRKDEHNYIFGISRHRAWQIVKDSAIKAGLPNLINPETGKIHNVSPHKLRDAFATNAVKLDDSGDGLRLLQEHLGHVSFNTTAKYRKVAGEELKGWYNKLWIQESKHD